MSYGEALFQSVLEDNLRIFITLLAKDPGNINQQNETGQTLLHVACAHGKSEVMLVLLNHKIDIMAQEEVYKYSALHLACLFEQRQIVSKLLSEVPTNPEFVNLKDKCGWTALHHAARNGHLELCQQLINREADPTITNEVGKTPCHYAARHSHIGVLSYLYDYSLVIVWPPVRNSECENLTLLHCAALGGHGNVIQWLRMKSYPPVAKSERCVDFINDRVVTQYPDEVADVRGCSSVRVALLHYRQMYQEWIDDIAKNKVTLDRIKLCICGFPRVGKSAMRQSLSRPFLQSLLGRNVEVTRDDCVDRCTVGIEITSMQLSGKDLFSVWDFAGQIENFITHQLFISTQSTVFTVLINLTDSVDNQRYHLMRWLGFIKMRNLGQIPLSSGLLEADRGVVPMICDEESDVLLKVPVIIVGSHYDQIPTHHQRQLISTVQTMIDELKEKFREYLHISPHIFPLNCLRAVSPEITHLKEHLCEARSNLIQIQPQYPRVVELIARKIECLRVEQPRLKMMTWENMKKLVEEKVNCLLSDRQLTYVLKCLTNAGVLVYLEQGALVRFIFIDPGWLCQDVLGKALIPESFPIAHKAATGSQISEEALEMKFAEHIDKSDIPVIIDMLQHFDLCYRLPGNNSILKFPAFITETLDKNLWQPDGRYICYSGRHLVSTEETDTFPPGFFSRLQVLVSRVLRQDIIHHFKGSFLVDAGSRQCLASIDLKSTAISIIGRAEEKDASACIGLMDLIQNQIAALVKDVCPTLFITLQIPSSSDLKLHFVQPHYYSIREIVSGRSLLINPVTKASDSVTNLLYLGDEEYRRTHSGKQTKIAYIPDEIIQKVQELLSDGESNWSDLARALGLEKYVTLLENRAPDSTRLLLLKWGEKSKWTVDALLSALKQIDRTDVSTFIATKF